MQATVAALRAAYDQLAALPIDALNASELVGVLDDLETLTCQLPAQSHRMLACLQTETTAKEMGAKSGRTCWGSGGASRQPKPRVGSRRPPSWGHVAR